MIISIVIFVRRWRGQLHEYEVGSRMNCETGTVVFVLSYSVKYRNGCEVTWCDVGRLCAWTFTCRGLGIPQRTPASYPKKLSAIANSRESIQSQHIDSFLTQGLVAWKTLRTIWSIALIVSWNLYSSDYQTIQHNPDTASWILSWWVCRAPAKTIQKMALNWQILSTGHSRCYCAESQSETALDAAQSRPQWCRVRRQNSLSPCSSVSRNHETRQRLDRLFNGGFFYRMVFLFRSGT